MRVRHLAAAVLLACGLFVLGPAAFAADATGAAGAGRDAAAPGSPEPGKPGYEYKGLSRPEDTERNVGGSDYDRNVWEVDPRQPGRSGDPTGLSGSAHPYTQPGGVTREGVLPGRKAGPEDGRVGGTAGQSIQNAPQAPQQGGAAKDMPPAEK